MFGKLRREIEASQLDALAAAKARDAVLVSVIANVARAYIELRGYQAQLAVIRRNMEAARRSLQVAQTRYSQGLTNELDVTLAQRQLATFEANLGPLTGQIQSSQYVIAGLLGQYPETLTKELRAEGIAPRYPARIPIGLPAFGMSTGNALIPALPPASFKTETGTIVRKRPLASSAWRDGIEDATSAAWGTSSPLARNTSATIGPVGLSRGGKAQGSFIKSASFIRRRRHHGFRAPAATTKGSS